MGAHIHIDLQISGRSSVLTCIALTPHIQQLVIVDARGNIDFYAFLPPHMACAAAGFAGLFNHLSAAAALITASGSLHHPKRCSLAHTYMACAAAGGTSLRAGSLFGAAAAAVRTIFDPGKGDCLFASFGRFLK